MFQSLGTQANPVTFDSDTKMPGTWGGFACDSAKSVRLSSGQKFTTQAARMVLEARVGH